MNKATSSLAITKDLSQKSKEDKRNTILTNENNLDYSPRHITPTIMESVNKMEDIVSQLHTVESLREADEIVKELRKAVQTRIKNLLGIDAPDATVSFQVFSPREKDIYLRAKWAESGITRTKHIRKAKDIDLEPPIIKSSKDRNR
jgi:hypothetical protein